MKTKDIILIIIVFSLGGILSYIIFQRKDDHSKEYYSPKIEILRDTIYEIIEPKKLNIKAKPKIFSIDTIDIISKAFEMKLDTIIARDTISIAYSYPSNLLSLSIATMPDTVAKFNIAMYKEPPPSSQNIWLERIGILVFGLGLGLMIGK